MRARPTPLKTQSGFTLIELVGVIVIVGILAAVSMPLYKSITREATNVTASSIGAAIEIASQNNRLAYAAGSSSAIVVDGSTPVCTKPWTESMLSSPPPSGFNPRNVTGRSCTVPGSEYMMCASTVSGVDGVGSATTTYKVYCAGN